MSANFAETRTQHTLKYKKEGDYGKERPYVTPVFYEDGIKLFPGTCEKCVYDTGNHSLTCSASKYHIAFDVALEPDETTIIEYSI